MMTEEYKEEYKKARKAAMKQYRTCASRGWSLYPPVLDEVSAYVKTAGEEVLGEMEIPLSLVTGTRTAGRRMPSVKIFFRFFQRTANLQGSGLHFMRRRWKRGFETRF